LETVTLPLASVVALSSKSLWTGSKVLVGEADLIAVEAGNGGLAGGADRHRTGDVERGAGRAVEIARVDVDLGGLAGLQQRHLGLQRQLQPLGDVILDEEGDLADRLALRVGIGLNAPGAGRGAGDQRIEWARPPAPWSST
jgi:hypothetical protein